MNRRSLNLPARRMWAADWRRNLALGITLAVALCGIVLVGYVRSSVEERSRSEAHERYGTARITLPATGAGEAETSGWISGTGGWITSSQAERMSDILAVENVMVRPRVETDAVLRSGPHTSILLVISNEWDTADIPNSGPTLAHPDALLLPWFARHVEEPDIGGFVNLVEAGLSFQPLTGGASGGPLLTTGLLRVLKDAGIAPEHAVGNVLQIQAAAGRSPSVVAFNARELLTREFPGVQVTGQAELAGPAAMISAGNLSLLARIALSLPAVAALVGAVLVGVESRSRQIVLLHAMGFTAISIQGMLVREMLLISLPASLAAVAVGLLAGVIIPGLSVTAAPLVNAVLLGVLAPATLTFLVVRRVLSTRLHDRMAEARG